MKGLTDIEVENSRKRNGSNEIVKNKSNSFIKLILNSLGDPIIKILLIALAVKTIFLFKNFDWYETIGIVISILVASFISSISEYGSEKAFVELQKELNNIKSKVIRNNKLIEINIDDIVVNDIVKLESGDKVPADGVIIEGNISLDESSLNGESNEVYKKINDTIYRGTIVYSGECFMKVKSVGINTFYGNIALKIQEEQPITPLKSRLIDLAKFISKIGYIGAFLVFISYLFKVIVINNNFDINLIKSTITNFPVITGYILYALTLAVTIIIVAVPEGLPMMITLVLSSNMKRMLKENVLVRKMIGIETSGNINILFTDKTGTLTTGILEVIDIVDKNGKTLDKNNELKLSCLGNNSSYYSNNDIVGGNITDRSILKYFNDKNFSIKKELVIHFNSENKYSITRINKINYIKGAPEVLNKYIKDKINIQKYTKKGIRVLMLIKNDNDDINDLSNSTFIGLILIKDVLRDTTKEGVNNILNANIKVVMITGDNKDTALAIAKESGIYKSNDLVLTSDELNKLSDIEVKNILPKLSVIARSMPQDKSRMVRLCQELGLVVGMTGDGVNDSLALKISDVGFSMGSGTEVAKEASDIVILDNNIKSISNAILFGRTIFKSIRKFIILQLTINICALSLSIIGPFIGIDTPITVIQMLWINMVMDTLAGVAYSFEPPLKEYMLEHPKEKNEHIINKYMLNEIIYTGLFSSLLCILFLKVPFINNIYINQKHLYTAFFGLFIFIDIFNSLNARTHKLNLFSNINKNKTFIIILIFIIVMQLFLIYYGGSIFRTTGLTLKELLLTIFISFLVIPFDFIRKKIFYKKNKTIGV